MITLQNKNDVSMHNSLMDKGLLMFIYDFKLVIEYSVIYNKPYKNTQ